MSTGAITKFNTPWRVIDLGGTDHGCRQGEEQDFAFDVVDADGNLICETDNKEMADKLAHFPELCEALLTIWGEEPEGQIEVGWDGTPEWKRCDGCLKLSHIAAEALQELEAQDGKSAE